MAYWGGGFFHYMYMREKYERLKNDENERANYKGFGIRAIISCSLLILLNAILFMLVFTLNFDSVGGWVKGIMAIVFGIATAGSACGSIPYIIWQKKLNSQPVWIAALILIIVSAATSLALIVTGAAVAFFGN